MPLGSTAKGQRLFLVCPPFSSRPFSPFPQLTFVPCLFLVACADSYAGMVGQSPVVDDLLGRLSRQVRAETSVEKELIKLVGAMDMVMAAQEGPGVMLDVTGGEKALVPVGEVGKKRGRVSGEGEGEEEEEEEEESEEEEEEQEEDEEIDDGDSSEDDQRIEELLEDVEEEGEGEEDEDDDDDDDDEDEEDE